MTLLPFKPTGVTSRHVPPELSLQPAHKAGFLVLAPHQRHPAVADDLDDARLLPHLRNRARLEESIALTKAQREQLRAEYARAQADGQEPKLPKSVATAAGDSRKLRGIPAIGRSVAGHINGTNPETETVRRSEQAA